MSHYCWPHLKRTQGNIVNVGSRVALSGDSSSVAYSAAKAGILGLTRALATRSASENLGIRVNCVLPGDVNTPAYQQYIKDNFASSKEGMRVLGSRVPFGERPTQPEEIASTIVFLSSNALAGHIIGEFTFADGGYVRLDRNL